MICLNENYSTTRLLTQEKPEIINNPEDKFETVLFLPEGENRKGEGGLRTKEYFKKSYTDKPLISVITVVYNGEKYLEETIQSVINQTYDNVEYIIIDGGSTDGTLDIIKKYEDKIDYWVSERDEGIYDAMNKGITLANGEWLNFMNAGDKFYNQSIIMEIFKTVQDYDLIYGPIELIGDIKKPIQVIPKKFNLFNLLFWNTGTVCHQTMFVRSRIIERYSLLYGLKAELDWYFMLEKKVHTYKIVQTPIAYYRLGGLSSNSYISNIKETLIVIFSNYNILGMISLPFLAYTFFKGYINNLKLEDLDQ